MARYPIKGGWVQLDPKDANLLTLAHWHIVRGYVQATVDGKQVWLHGLILGKMAEGSVADHKNLDGLDNRRRNLRPATRGQNNMNRGKRADNKSGYKGVHLCVQTGKWRAEISANKIKHKLGRFDTPIEAALAYDEAALTLHGEFARTNFGRKKG